MDRTRDAAAFEVEATSRPAATAS